MSFATYARLPHTVIVLNCKSLAGHDKGFKIWQINFNRYSLLKHGLPVLFEFKGRRNFREYTEFTQTYGGFF